MEILVFFSIVAIIGTMFFSTSVTLWEWGDLNKDRWYWLTMAYWLASFIPTAHFVIWGLFDIAKRLL